MKPSITVLIPAYKAASFILPVLKSISTQTFEHFVAFISIDFEDDRTHEICTIHAKSDPRFSVIRQPKRLGWVGNSNKLL